MTANIRITLMGSPRYSTVTMVPAELAVAAGLFCQTCGFSDCACTAIAGHAPDCAYRRAATMAIEIPCDHGRAVCPECDACSCGAVVPGA